MNCGDIVRANEVGKRELHLDGNIVYRLIRSTRREGEWIARDDKVGLIVSVQEQHYERVVKR